MAKLTLTDLASLSNETSAITTINNNNTAIETALENTLSRDGTTPNTMGADLDLNTHFILNLAQATTAGHAVEYTQLQDRVDEMNTIKDDAESYKNQAAAYASATAADAVSTAADVVSADTILDEIILISDAFHNSYLGAYASNPTVDNDGNALTVGDLYFNSVVNEFRVWNGTVWINVAAVTTDSHDTLLNKSIALGSNTITGTLAQFNTALTDDDFVSLTGSETLTNKTLTTPKIASILTNSGAATLTLPSSTDTLVGRNTTDTLTNKTLTSPTLNTPSINNAVLTSATVTTNISPTTNDGAALGSASLMFSDLFLASGAVINFNNGDVTITHSTNQLNFGGASNGYGFDQYLNITTATPTIYFVDTGSSSVNYISTTSAGVLTFMADRDNGSASSAIQFSVDGSSAFQMNSGSFYPTTNDSKALGSASLNFSDLFLASGAVINFNNGDVTITHGTNTLTFAGASSGYLFDSTITGQSSLILNAANAGIELGSSTGNTPFIDFHSSANTVDYDARIIASGGTASSGNGTLTVTAADLLVPTGTSSTSAVNRTGTQTLTNKTINIASNTLTGVAATAGNQNLTGGFTATSDGDGTISSGTYTPDPLTGNFKHITANGAFTLAPPTSVCTLVVEVTNGASAGTITTSGFTKKTGDNYGTTSSNKFLFFITKTNSYSHLQIQALQ